MSKYNESSTNWKLDSWHSIVLQIFILALICGLSIFIYAKFFVGDRIAKLPTGPRIKALETENRKFSVVIATLKDAIKEAEKDLDVIVGDKKSGQVTLNQAAESFDTMFILLGSINDEDQNATFKDAQAAYNKLEGALKKLKESDLFKLKVTIASEEGKVFGQKNEIKRIQTLIGSRKKDVEEYNKWKDKALKSTDAAEKKLAKGKVDEMYKVTIYAETQLEKLAVDLVEAETKLKKLEDDVKQAKAKKKELDDKVAGYDDKLEKFDERMAAWKSLVKDNNKETVELFKDREQLTDLREKLSSGGDDVVYVLTANHLAREIKENEDIIANAQEDIERKTTQANAKQAGLEALIGFYKTMNIDIPADPSLPTLPDGSVQPKPTDEVDPPIGREPLPDLPGVTPIPPTTGNVPIDPSTGLPTATGLGGISAIPPDVVLGAGVVPGFEEKQTENAIEKVEGIRAEIKKLRSEIEQHEKEKQKAEGLLEEVKQTLVTFKQGIDDREAQFEEAESIKTNLKMTKKRLREYVEEIDGDNVDGGLAQLHEDSMKRELVALGEDKKHQITIREKAQAEILLLEEDVELAEKDREEIKEKLITALLTDQPKKKVEDLQKGLSEMQEDADGLKEDLKSKREVRKGAIEKIDELADKITEQKEDIEVFKAQRTVKKSGIAKKNAKVQKLDEVYDKLLDSEAWEKAASEFVRKTEEDRTSDYERIVNKRKSAVGDAKKLVTTLKDTNATLAFQLKLWKGMQARGNSSTQETAALEIEAISEAIGTNDNALFEANENVKDSEIEYKIALEVYQKRLETVKGIFADLDTREQVLGERKTLLASAKANANMAQRYNGELSTRERKSKLSDLAKQMADEQDSLPKKKAEVDRLVKVIAGLNSDREMAKTELDVGKKRFEGAELGTDSIGNAARELATLANKIKELSKQLGLKQDELAKKNRSHKNTIDLVAVLQETHHTIATFQEKKPVPLPVDPALKQLRVAFKPYYTDPKGIPKGYDDGVYLVMEEPKDKAAAKIAFAKQEARVEELVNDFNYFRGERDKSPEEKRGNYTAAMDEVWDNIKEGEHKADLDENGQFHYKDPVPRKTGDVVKLYVFCIGRKDDKLRFYVDEVTFDKSPKEPHAILLSSAK